MYRALYRKWRPSSFDEVVGQEQITDILKYQVAENRTSHAYLFCGSRGTGKTSCAKILAKAVNCLNPVNGNPCNACEACRSIDAGVATDVIEMDAASNNGVDNVRDMKEEIVFTPAELKYRVYIIDEVHMMSASAFNALLKTLEEPPSYVLFVLATTELSKLPSTIVSRCQRYDFRRLTTDAMISRLRHISAEEGIRLEDSGARLIAKMAQGGMRDAISLLELCAGTGEAITESLAARILGVGGRDTPGKVVDALVNRDYPTLYRLVDELVRSSEDISVFWGELYRYYRDLIVVKTIGDAKEYLDLTDGEQSALSDRAQRIPLARMIYHSKVLEETLEGLRRAGQGKRSIAELALVRMCEPKLSSSPESLVSRIDELEKQLARLVASGAVGSPVSTQAPVTAPCDSRSDGHTEIKTQTEEKPQAAGEKDTPKETEEKPKPLDIWGLILEEFAEIKPSLRPFLKGSSAEISSDGTLTVRLTVKLFLGMLSGDEASKTMLLNLVKAKGVDARALRFVSVAKQENTNQIEF